MGPSKPDRAASRLRRGAANEWGFGGHVVAPKTRARRSRVTAPPGTANEWGFGGHAVAPKTRARQSRVTAPPGARRTNGGLGAMSWPPKRAPDRAASRLRRGAANVWGFGGHVVAPKARAGQRRVTAPPGRDERLGVWGPCRGPQSVRRTEPRHGSAGARRTRGGLG